MNEAAVPVPPLDWSVFWPRHRITGWRSIDDMIRKLRRLARRCDDAKRRRETLLEQSSTSPVTAGVLIDEIDDAADFLADIYMSERDMWGSREALNDAAAAVWDSEAERTEFAWHAALVPLLVMIYKSGEPRRDGSCSAVKMYSFSTFGFVFPDVEKMAGFLDATRALGVEPNDLLAWHRKVTDGLAAEWADLPWRIRSTTFGVTKILNADERAALRRKCQEETDEFVRGIATAPAVDDVDTPF